MSNIKPINSPFYETLTSMTNYYEWLANMHPEEFEKVLNDQEDIYESSNLGEQKVSFMKEDYFWDIIGKYLDEDNTQSLIKYLIQLNENHIIEFNNTLANMIENLFVLKVYDPLVENDDYLSEDAILYTKGYVFSRGELYYKKVLESGILDLSDDNHSFEELLYVAEEALELRGVQIDYDKMKNIE